MSPISPKRHRTRGHQREGVPARARRRAAAGRAGERRRGRGVVSSQPGPSAFSCSFVSRRTSAARSIKPAQNGKSSSQHQTTRACCSQDDRNARRNTPLRPRTSSGRYERTRSSGLPEVVPEVSSAAGRQHDLLRYFLPTRSAASDQAVSRRGSGWRGSEAGLGAAAGVAAARLELPSQPQRADPGSWPACWPTEASLAARLSLPVGRATRRCPAVPTRLAQPSVPSCCTPEVRISHSGRARVLTCGSLCASSRDAFAPRLSSALRV
jgi:hypothetical protein